VSRPGYWSSGEEVRYRPTVASRAGDLKYAVEEPATGMSVSPDGILSWKHPADAPAEVRGAVRVKDEKGAQTVHSFPLTKPD
jgi:hypothetical protein